MPRAFSFVAYFLPMPHTSSIGYSCRAFVRRTSLSMMQQWLYPATFLAKWLATLARVLFGAMPMLTGMPTHFLIFLCRFSPHAFSPAVSMP